MSEVRVLPGTQTLRGGEVVSRWAHNPKAAGSSPAPATIPVEGILTNKFHAEKPPITGRLFGFQDIR